MKKQIHILSSLLLLATATNAVTVSASAEQLPQTAMDQPLNEKGYLTREIAPSIFMVTDSIYQAMFAVTDEGVVVFDVPYSMGEKLQLAIREVTETPVSHLIYSHAHVDHIGGAAIFGDQVQRIASEETAEKLVEAQDPRRPLVTQSFSKAVNMTVGRLEIEMRVTGKGHLDGNLFIFLPQHKILMNVDVIYPGWVPFTNLGMAEDVQGFIDQHDSILDYDFSVFVGGHLGRPGTRKDVLIAKEYVLDLIRYAQLGHEQANFYQAAQRVGWENKWLLVKSFMDEVTQVCATNMLKRWSSRLGGAEVSTPGHCFIMQEHISINGLPLRIINQVNSGDQK
ncbi:MBL fold metallo-hydrolase [Tenacibaculum sp. KUL152]|nr:MBL fold metallo-hydrolase [Tenacibaculum sp. KUL152]